MQHVDWALKGDAEPDTGGNECLACGMNSQADVNVVGTVNPFRSGILRLMGIGHGPTECSRPGCEAGRPFLVHALRPEYVATPGNGSLSVLQCTSR